MYAETRAGVVDVEEGRYPFQERRLALRCGRVQKLGAAKEARPGVSVAAVQLLDLSTTLPEVVREPRLRVLGDFARELCDVDLELIADVVEDQVFGLLLKDDVATRRQLREVVLDARQ